MKNTRYTLAWNLAISGIYDYKRLSFMWKLRVFKRFLRIYFTDSTIKTIPFLEWKNPLA